MLVVILEMQSLNLYGLECKNHSLPVRSWNGFWVCSVKTQSVSLSGRVFFCCTIPSERVMEYSNCHSLLISFTFLCQFQYKPNFHVCLFFINFCKFPLVCGGELMIVEWKHSTNGGWKIINVAPVYKYWISLKYFWFWKPGINKINLNVFRCWVCLCARQRLH